MKRVYSTPVVEFEEYSLTNQVAGACRDAGKTPIDQVSPITITNTAVHCVIADTNVSKNCSEGAHTWQVALKGTIFADGNKAGGCDYDVYNQEDYVKLLISSMSSGSTISGAACTAHNGKHFCFKGQSHEHTGSFEVADYSNYFES